MKRYLLFFLLFPLLATSQEINKYIPAKPAYVRLYNDENAYAYYHSQWRKLEDKLILHQKKTGNQLVIVTVATIGEHSIDEIATATFRKWGIGDREANTGLLIMIARKEKQIRIETGYGLEGDIPDITAKHIINNILKPSLDSFDFVLPPLHPQQGYLPAMERVIDTLISLTKEPNPLAVKNVVNNKAALSKRRYTLLVIGLFIMASLLFLLRRRKSASAKISTKENTDTIHPVRKKKRRLQRTTTGQYLYPFLLLFLISGATVLWELKWVYAIVVAVFLFMRWIYYLPSPKLKAETIAFNKEWETKRNRLKEEYKEKRKLLGSEKLYENFDAYMAKYFELGLDIIEKELKVGVFTPGPGKSNKEYDVKSLLYDIFLGTTVAEKKGSFSSTQTKGYGGESTGGQSADNFGGGSSGGGGASS